MGSPHAVGTRRARSVALGVLLSALLVGVSAAAPALAASAKVVRGDTRLTIPAAQVTALTALGVAILPVSPVSFGFAWNNAVSWWLDSPMKSGSAFDYSLKKGTFYHGGGLRFVNVATDKTLLLSGLRVNVMDARAVTASFAVGTPPATRAVVFAATNPCAFAKRGKTIKIDGAQLRLTAAGALAIKLALGVDLPTTTLFADADLRLKIK